MFGTGSFTNPQVAALAAAIIPLPNDLRRTQKSYDEWFDHILSKLDNVPQLIDTPTFGDT